MPAPILSFDGIPFPGVDVQLRAARHERRGRRDAVRPDREPGLSGLQQDDRRLGLRARRDRDALERLRRRLRDSTATATRSCSTTSSPTAGSSAQFASATGGLPTTDECVAVSQTGDATGAYYRYDFHLGSDFFDYPHLGVWPDAYYMSDERLQLGGHRLPRPAAVRVRPRRDARRHAGDLHHLQRSGFFNRSADAMLPADLDGSTPAAGRRTRPVPGVGREHDVVAALPLPRRLRHSRQLDLHARRRP